jgi:hypothetical protein
MALSADKLLTILTGMVFFDKNLLDHLKIDPHSRRHPTYFLIGTIGD